MTLFYSPRPRRFNHRLIYSDERKELFKKIEERAKHESGMPDDEHRTPEYIREAFSGATKHVRRQKEKRDKAFLTTQWFTSTVAIAALLLFAYWLLTGRFPI